MFPAPKRAKPHAFFLLYKGAKPKPPYPSGRDEAHAHASSPEVFQAYTSSPAPGGARPTPPFPPPEDPIPVPCFCSRMGTSLRLLSRVRRGPSQCLPSTSIGRPSSNPPSSLRRGLSPRPRLPSRSGSNLRLFPRFRRGAGPRLPPARRECPHLVSSSGEGWAHASPQASSRRGSSPRLSFTTSRRRCPCLSSSFRRVPIPLRQSRSKEATNACLPLASIGSLAHASSSGWSHAHASISAYRRGEIQPLPF